MVYINQDDKKTIQANLKPILNKYKLKGSLRIHHHSKIVLTIRSGEVDFFNNALEKANSSNVGNRDEHIDRAKYYKQKGYMQVNEYHLDTFFSGDVLECLEEIKKAMMSADWYDESDAMTDYINTAYYYNIQVGEWDKPYQLTGNVEEYLTA